MRLLATTLVGVLVGLLLINSALTLYARISVSRAQATLNDRWLPAQTHISELLSAYVDEETGERGFLLTGDAVFLQPYKSGEVAAARLARQLTAEFARDATSAALLHQVVVAYAAWRHRSAIPQIAARRAGAMSQGQLDADALHEKALFDALRGRMARLSNRTTSLISAELRRISDAQELADIVTAVTVALALLSGVLALPVTRRVLTRPLEGLLGQLQRVASGDYDRTVEPEGAAELVAMARSAEQMRQSLLIHSEDLVRAQRTLTLREERDRFAADLHDRSIQRLFAIGLTLSSLVRRHPDASDQLLPLIDETDRGIRELRAIIFDISHDGETSVRKGVDTVVREFERTLGFSPEVELRGPVDQVAGPELTGALLAVLREALSNVARHAQASAVRVTVSADADSLHLVVSDDGVGLLEGPRGHGISNMESRAARLGGSVELRPGAPGTTLEWAVPAPRV